jgi:hypothetical protein
MGGLVAREAIRQDIDGNLDALITVGTPHLGAPLANSPSAFPALLLDWTFDIINPLVHTIEYVGGIDLAWVQQVEQVVSTIAAYGQPIVNPYLTGSAPASDLKTYSSFLGTLNASPAQTIPSPSRMFVIYGDEDPMTHWRILQTAAFGNVEDGNWAGFFSDLADLYEIAFVTAAGAALLEIVTCVDTYVPGYCDGVLDLFAIAASFYIAKGISGRSTRKSSA